MKTIEIRGSFRKELGKKDSRQIRKDGNVPCVIYDKEKNLHFYAHENSFLKLVYTHEAHLVKLLIDDQVINAVLHDMQFHPVTDKIIHADFMKIFDNKPVVIDVPVTVTGESAGVKAGGKLIVKRRHLKVRGLAATSRVALKTEEEEAAEAAAAAAGAEGAQAPAEGAAEGKEKEKDKEKK